MPVPIHTSAFISIGFLGGHLVSETMHGFLFLINAARLLLPKAIHNTVHFHQEHENITVKSPGVLSMWLSLMNGNWWHLTAL